MHRCFHLAGLQAFLRRFNVKIGYVVPPDKEATQKVELSDLRNRVRLVNEWMPPPSVDFVPFNCPLKALPEFYLRLPAEPLDLLAIERVPEIVAWTIWNERYHRVGKG